MHESLETALVIPVEMPRSRKSPDLRRTKKGQQVRPRRISPAEMDKYNVWGINLLLRGLEWAGRY